MLVLSFTLAFACGQIFTWTSADGVQHFTDDPRAVPAGVKVKQTEGAELGEVSGGPQPLPMPALPPLPPVQPPQVTVVAAPDPEEKWRRLFREARERIASLEEAIEADRKQVEEVSGLPMRQGFVCQQWAAPVVLPVVQGGVVMPAPGVALGASTTTSTSASVSSFPAVVVPCTWSFSPEFERIRERLEKNRRELPRAKDALQELDRRASFEAVPLHWRR